MEKTVRMDTTPFGDRLSVENRPRYIKTQNLREKSKGL